MPSTNGRLDGHAHVLGPAVPVQSAPPNSRGSGKLRAAFAMLVLVLAVYASVPPSSAVGGGDAQGQVKVPGDGAASPPDNGPNEPENDGCEGALKLPTLTHGMRDDMLGSTDPGDWFTVELYRTETLASSAGGVAVVTFADSCSYDAIPDAPTMVSANDDYALLVSAGTGPYKLAWDITSNDANAAGYDIGDTFANGHPVSAMPSYAPQVPISGSIPNRGDQPLGPDQDWFRLNTPLLEMPTSGETNLALGLLTAVFVPDCNGGTYYLQLYQEEGLTPVGSRQGGCGTPLTSSCITMGLSAVHAQVWVDPYAKGTGYEFMASTSPLYFVWIDENNLPTTGNLDPDKPWCNPIVPLLLSLLPSGNALVDQTGRVVAVIPKVQVLN